MRTDLDVLHTYLGTYFIYPFQYQHENNREIHIGNYASILFIVPFFFLSFQTGRLFAQVCVKWSVKA